MTEIKDIIRRFVIPIGIALICIYSMRECNHYKSLHKQSVDNLKVVMDSVTNYRKVNGKLFAENSVLRLTSDELKATNSRLANDIKVLSKRRKTPLNGTSVTIVHDTIVTTERVVDSVVNFSYEDSCISIGVDSGYLSYVIKPTEVTIVQYQKGKEIIASASYSGCGTIVGVSSISIDNKKRRLPWFWIGLGSGTLLTLILTR